MLALSWAKYRRREPALQLRGVYSIMTQHPSLTTGHDETGAKSRADELQVVNAELRANIVRLETAFNNMSQGMLMFDSQEQIVVCNDFYIDMYGLSRDVVKPGCSLIDLLRHRVATGGDLNRGPQQYRLEQGPGYQSDGQNCART
jgi:PAS domain-containing protein